MGQNNTAIVPYSNKPIDILFRILYKIKNKFNNKQLGTTIPREYYEMFLNEFIGQGIKEKNPKEIVQQNHHTFSNELIGQGIKEKNSKEIVNKKLRHNSTQQIGANELELRVYKEDNIKIRAADIGAAIEAYKERINNNDNIEKDNGINNNDNIKKPKGKNSRGPRERD